MNESNLSANHDGASCMGALRILFDAVVKRDDVKDVEQLAFIFVDSFHLNVEHRRRVHAHVELFLYVTC